MRKSAHMIKKGDKVSGKIVTFVYTSRQKVTTVTFDDQSKIVTPRSRMIEVN